MMECLLVCERLYCNVIKRWVKMFNKIFFSWHLSKRCATKISIDKYLCSSDGSFVVIEERKEDHFEQQIPEKKNGQ